MLAKSKNFTLFNDGIDGPMDYIDEKTDFILSIIDGNHAGYNAILADNPGRCPYETILTLVELDYSNWLNSAAMAK